MVDVAFNDLPEAPALEAVEDYVTDIRVLLLDTTIPYRYDDGSMLIAINTTIQQIRRLRPDLFVYQRDPLPAYTAVDDTVVPIEQQFRLALVYGAISHCLARDQEDVQDARAASFQALMEALLLGVRTPPIQGGGTEKSKGK
jgi:hypothetical protein